MAGSSDQYLIIKEPQQYRQLTLYYRPRIIFATIAKVLYTRFCNLQPPFIYQNLTITSIYKNPFTCLFRWPHAKRQEIGYYNFLIANSQTRPFNINTGSIHSNVIEVRPQINATNSKYNGHNRHSRKQKSFICHMTPFAYNQKPLPQQNHRNCSKPSTSKVHFVWHSYNF